MFDLDGTLVDSMNCYHAVFLDAFGQMGLPIVEKAELMALMRHGRNILDVLIPEDWPDRAGTTERCRTLFREMWEVRSLTEIRLHDEVAPTLRRLRAQGLTLGLATAARGAWIQRVLERHEVAGLLAAVVTAADVKQRKPAPDLLLECLRRLGSHSDRSVYVGDSPIDIIAAKAAGVRPIGVLCGASDRAALLETEPDLILEHVGQLPAVLEAEKQA
ncbi:MAG TPA: HAD family hydrolase [Chloroflexota bacterium]|nr:HAD family hydrolase [Chloroflexota bacterium]